MVYSITTVFRAPRNCWIQYRNCCSHHRQLLDTRFQLLFSLQTTVVYRISTVIIVADNCWILTKQLLDTRFQLWYTISALWYTCRQLWYTVSQLCSAPLATVGCSITTVVYRISTVAQTAFNHGKSTRQPQIYTSKLIAILGSTAEQIFSARFSVSSLLRLTSAQTLPLTISTPFCMLLGSCANHFVPLVFI